jgi:IS30 family transposase
MNELEQLDNNKKRCTWQQITEVQRYKIEGYIETKMTQKRIAELIGVSERTIRREIAMGKVVQRDSELRERRVYKADFAQLQNEKREENKGRGLSIGKNHALVRFLEYKIKNENFSPDAALAAARKSPEFEGQKLICTKTLYTYIDEGLFLGISNKDLPVKKEGKKRNYHKIRKVALNNKSGKSISERPTVVDEREEKGHWEIDLVVGKQGTKPVVLTLVERKSRKSLYVLVKNKTQEEVLAAIKKAAKKVGGDFSEVFKSITADNGSEFLDSVGIKAAANCGEVYYAHPYSSWERGSNENGNRILRRFIPKGTDLSDLTEKELQQYEDWVNNYPRRILKYLTANEVFAA